jgi:hypothetical protein
MTYLTLEEVLSEAMSITKTPDKYEAAARQWAWTALMQTGVTEQDMDVVLIDVKNFIAKKPKNFRKLDDLALYDAAGNEINHIFRQGRKRIFPDRNAIARSRNEDGTEEVVYGAVDVSEDRYNIHIGTNGSNVTTVALRYYTLPIDTNGEPMISEEEKLSVIFYIRYMIAELEDDNQSKVARMEIRWKQECDRARAAKKSTNNSSKQRQNGREWLRLIPNFNRSQF